MEWSRLQAACAGRSGPSAIGRLRLLKDTWKRRHRIIRVQRGENRDHFDLAWHPWTHPQACGCVKHISVDSLTGQNIRTVAGVVLEGDPPQLEACSRTGHPRVRGQLTMVAITTIIVFSLWFIHTFVAMLFLERCVMASAASSAPWREMDATGTMIAASGVASASGWRALRGRKRIRFEIEHGASAQVSRKHLPRTYNRVIRL